jgi:putative transposase
MRLIKAFKLKHISNAGKLKEAVKVVKAYRKLAVSIASEQWRPFQKGEDQCYKNCDIKHISFIFSLRYRQTCQHQVAGVLDSFISNRQNDFVSI